ncbi:hypothetical protein K1719_012785 [Acacia pycnantha]|nr:hypothetical protein K1719_012785 [Acacia pycnantha]
MKQDAAVLMSGLKNVGLLTLMHKVLSSHGRVRNGKAWIYKRLDRCLCSGYWHEKFEDVEVRVLPRLCSDHHPLMIQTARENKSWRPRNFKYEAMWKSHDQFDYVMTASWRRNEEAHVNLATLQLDLIKWNKEVFGQLEGWKRRILNRLNGIQQSMKSDSELWRNLVRIWPNLVENVHWEIGNGELADFWRDKWIEGNGSLLERCRGQLPGEEKGVKVCEMTNGNGE